MPSSRVRFRETEARRALRAASKEGLVVGSVDILPDGTIRVLTAPSGQAAPSGQEIDCDTNEWEAKYGKPGA